MREGSAGYYFQVPGDGYNTWYRGEGMVRSGTFSGRLHCDSLIRGAGCGNSGNEYCGANVACVGNAVNVGGHVVDAIGLLVTNVTTLW